MNKLLLSVVLVLALTLGACGDGGGIFTLTGIPSQFNGKYAIMYAGNNEVELLGMKNADKEEYTSVLISRGRVHIPIWTENSGAEPVRYTGNHTVEAEIIIVGGESFENSGDDLFVLYYESISFKNGNAKKSFNEADETHNLE